MKFYLAPMEGITGFVYRNSYEKFFHNIDKYFTPFIVPTSSKSFKTKELRDILPENNKGMYIVPQILTNDSEGFINTAEKLQQLGYNEINLNLGCPSGTVVSKGRGSGFLAKRDELDKFLDEIYIKDDIEISVKTRIGRDEPEEFYELIKIYNKYPIKELIIHPRTREDFYGNTPNLEVFKDALSLSTNPVCYNGDIFTLENYKNFKSEFSEVNEIMLGRGILANPGLIDEIINDKVLDKKVLKDFHDDILFNYREVFKDDNIALYRMKELWGYMIYIFSDNKKYSKKIKKSQNINTYQEAILELFNDQEIVRGAGLFSS
ncbi:tRNA-dihydrouridine synthase family protein [Clostridium sartagoforme]|uniref:tRNA-dihydrouridine synthase n=1 Tax=Clostridium sartagoforme TaxID=84031 RepID=A0A4S2DIY5_9CLOT|nr:MULTISPECIES: tRNA-dihydrouridine synthase family protein [Clostridium]MBS5938599.1 tRNA-dihydrouridine synthase family protein [Clostridium sp.]TGY41825.1 tRNA-dihydrouridine synthase family protein [Clostridium sartagoforme]